MRVLIAFALLCSVASAEDIFKPTGIYAVPAEKIQRLSNSIDELQATIDEIKSGAEEIGTAVEATKPIKLTLPKPAVTSATKMTHAEMVVTHNRLHGGGNGHGQVILKCTFALHTELALFRQRHNLYDTRSGRFTNQVARMVGVRRRHDGRFLDVGDR